MLRAKGATVQDIQLIRRITFQVWPVTYSPILSKEQIDYMLEMMYSEASLSKQINELKHSFVLCYDGNEPRGFASYHFLQNNIYKLEKIYVIPSFQGKGVGKYLLEFIYGRIKHRGGKKLTLNVNRNNPAVNFYKKEGFNIEGSEDIDIGNGFYMNDYIMLKEIE